jgi:hypothetical protein
MVAWITVIHQIADAAKFKDIVEKVGVPRSRTDFVKE